MGGGVIINIRVRRGGGREGRGGWGDGTLKEVEREAGARDGGGRWNRCDIEIKTRK